MIDKKINIIHLFMVTTSIIFSSEAWSTRYVWNCIDGYWQDASCWDPNGIPSAGDFAHVLGPNRLLRINDATSVTVRDLYLMQDGVVEQSGGDFTGGLSIRNGTYRQTGGRSDLWRLYLASVPTAHGSYELAGTGMLHTQYTEYIGHSGEGVFIQSGGTHQVGSSLVIGSRAFYRSGTGSYTLSGGNLTVGSNELVGWSGDGTFIQTGGMHRVDGSLSVGNWIGWGTIPINGTFNLSGGDFIVGRGEAIIYGAFTQSSGVHTTPYLNIGSYGHYVMDGGMLDVTRITDTSGGFDFRGGALSVDVFNGDLVNAGGTLTPGNSPGTTIINGNYIATASSILDIEIGGLTAGTDYDMVDINGNALLDGILNVSLWSNFTPTPGDTFDILKADSITGMFSNLLFPTFNGYTFDIDYLSSPTGKDIVRLSVIPQQSPARTPGSVPEPDIIFLMGIGFIGLARCWVHTRQIRRTKF